MAETTQHRNDNVFYLLILIKINEQLKFSVGWNEAAIGNTTI